VTECGGGYVSAWFDCGVSAGQCRGRQRLPGLGAAHSGARAAVLLACSADRVSRGYRAGMSDRRGGPGLVAVAWPWSAGGLGAVDRRERNRVLLRGARDGCSAGAPGRTGLDVSEMSTLAARWRLGHGALAASWSSSAATQSPMPSQWPGS
jgi:hypothetical protein